MEILSLPVISNMVASIASIIGAYLVGRAYIPHIPLRDDTAVAWLARCFVLCSAIYLCRTLYKDLYLPLSGYPPVGVWFNVLVNLGIIAGEYCALRARWESIPEGERHEWSVIRAVWYPDGPAIKRRRDRRA